LYAAHACRFLAGALVQRVDSAFRLDQGCSHRCVASAMPWGRRCGPSGQCVLYRNGICKPMRLYFGGIYQPSRVPPG
jgi:hypothetical protein